MRLRVLGILGSLLCLMAVLLSLALLQGLSRSMTQDVQLNRLASLNRFVQLAGHLENGSDEQMLQVEMDSYARLYSEGLLVNVGNRQLVAGPIDPDTAAVRALVREAGINLDRSEIPTISPFSDQRALIARPFGNSTQVLGSVIMNVNLEPARDSILQRWTQILLLTFGVCAGLLLLADRVTSWVLRPVNQLSRAVGELARTREPAPLKEAGPPELRALSRSFSDMAQAVTTSLTQQRELIAETSHQLRNPVAALRLRVDLLKLRLGAQAEAAGLSTVEQELHRVEILLDAVLRLASAEHRLTERSTQPPVEHDGAAIQVVCAARLLAEEVERQSALAAAAGTQLRLAALDDRARRATVRCNEFELQMVIDELVGNALKYAPGRPVDLGVIVHPDAVELTVRDHGRGLDPEELDNVTERFWRSASAQQQPGTGLGMAIVDRLVRANGGTLRLQAAPGGGLLAGIRLPRAADVPGTPGDRHG